MGKHIRLLIVEDSAAEQQTWAHQLEQHNAIAKDSGGFTIAHTFAKTKESALECIDRDDFDAAIVDLGLANEEGHQDANTNGNAVVEALVQSELAVVVIFTGQPGDALSAALRGPKVRVVSKGDAEGDGTKTVMKLLTDDAPMILTVRAAEKTIKREMAPLFSKSIWPRWKLWLDEKDSPDQEITAAMSRHLASHVYAALLEKAEQKVLSEEWYFVPPIRDGLKTGDLIELTEGERTSVAIVITPRCDLANNPGNSNETFQLALCDDVSEEWSKRFKKHAASKALKPATGASEEQVKKWKSDCAQTKEHLRALVQHRSKTNFHFLHEMRMPDGSTRGPFYIRFDKVRSLDRNSAAGIEISKATRIASVAPEFLPSIVERLGSYFSRIGTPDYSFVGEA